MNVLFDLYGTLADIRTDEKSTAYWRGVCRYLGMQGAHYTPQALRRQYDARVAALEAAAELPDGEMAEIDIAPVLRGFYEEAGLTADDRAVAELAKTFRVLSLKRLKLYPGVLPMLAALRSRGHKLYLLSNAQSLFTRPELTLLGLDNQFDGIQLSSEAGRKKPDPAFFRLLMDRYDMDPAETVMVGNDAVCDCHGAARAGLHSFYVQTEFSPALTAPLPTNCRQLAKIADLKDHI